jgi:glycosyltransferase involved in cell wall biosynthesis
MITVAVDASRNRSGGAKVHLVNILQHGDPRAHGIATVHVWSYDELLDALPDVPWIVKHCPPELNGSLPRQMWWQFHSLPDEVRAANCDIMLTTDAGSVCPFQPAVVMSRDMLSYEPGEMSRYGLSRSRLRLLALRYVQASSLKRAEGAVFLTKYAARVIQDFTGPLPNVAIIPHGVAEPFRRPPSVRGGTQPAGAPIRCLYVSPLDLYKHQWVVVRAIGQLRQRGHNVELTLVGGGDGLARELLNDEIARTDPGRAFVRLGGFVRQTDLPQTLHAADVFIFASSCENMPNTLVEAMASGLPIACSNRGPMPEVLQDGGTYFDPEDADSVAAAVEQLITDPVKRQECARRAFELAHAYSWERCARETWTFLARVQTQGAAPAVHSLQ